MPIYEYKCGRCDRVFEEFIRSAADEKSLKCPKCGSRKYGKMFSVFAAQGTQSKASSAAGSGCCNCHSGSCSTCRR